MESALYVGTVRHRRFAVRRHEFTYPLFLVCLEIDRIPELMRVSRLTSYNRFNWAAYHDRDHLGPPAVPLRERLRRDAAAHGHVLPEGPVFLVTHLRYLNYIFNPVSFYYCCDGGGSPRLILAEVNNTFGESHNYWFPFGEPRPRTAKAFHVSPFLPMGLEYEFRLNEPGEALSVHMDVLEGGRPVLDATLSLQRRPWTAAAIRRTLLEFPVLTAKVMAAIHWQAFRLFLKRVPVHRHPGKKPHAHDDRPTRPQTVL